MRSLFVAISLGILLLGLGGCKHTTDNVSIDNDVGTVDTS